MMPTSPPEQIQVGNCPVCNAFPVQRIAQPGGGTDFRFIRPAPAVASGEEVRTLLLDLVREVASSTIAILRENYPGSASIGDAWSYRKDHAQMVADEFDGRMAAEPDPTAPAERLVALVTGLPVAPDPLDLAAHRALLEARPQEREPERWGDQLRYLTDDRDQPNRTEMVIPSRAATATGTIGSVPEGENFYGRLVRVTTSGSHVPGLAVAISDAYRALRGEPPFKAEDYSDLLRRNEPPESRPSVDAREVLRATNEICRAMDIAEPEGREHVRSVVAAALNGESHAG